MFIDACMKRLDGSQRFPGDLRPPDRAKDFMYGNELLFDIYSTTGTCQPQCRNAVLNVYQNKLGRTLLKSDASCIPGREELKTCHFLPMAPIVHCSLAKLACEADLQVRQSIID
ncbi:unnamed protein product [Strongylus vulgaris]|uniref:Uncharacterized protein n=1 Tax=Strongylus vulgaris TaxID=40348 RepID=A0A3P7KHI8_STRVU|nr:unnamed protein product [Strongylus vulgaris]